MHVMKTLSRVLALALLVLLAACKKDVSPSPTVDTADKNLASKIAEQSVCSAIDPSNFGSSITNSYFPLTPGTVMHYLNRVIDGADTNYEQVVVSVLNDTKIIAGVVCQTVHDVVTVNGAVTEDTYDWYAQDKSGNVWYFGEHSKSLKDKNGATTEGSWKAGEQNACPGVIMWADPKSHSGEIYYQEFLSGVAEDQAQVINTNSKVTIPYGTFTN